MPMARINIFRRAGKPMFDASGRITRYRGVGKRDTAHPHAA